MLIADHRHGGAINLTAAEVVYLQNVSKGKLSKLLSWNISAYVPICAWAIWLLAGTLFYILHDDMSWSVGFYQSVNVGWSMGWSTAFLPSNGMRDAYSKLFSAIHASLGVVFTGVVIMYIAKKMAETSNTWATEIQVIQDNETRSETSNDHTSLPLSQTIYTKWVQHISRFRVIYVFVIWALGGILWAGLAVKSWGWGLAVDFTLSTLTGAGYIILPNGSPDAHYFIVALYTALGVPITAVTLGTLLSWLLASPETEDVMGKIVAEVTPEEVEFLKLSGIETEDGLLDHQAFLILTAIRMGAASPSLIEEIIERFNELDRKKEGRIAYDDVVVGNSKKYKKKANLRSIVRSDRFAELKKTQRREHSFQTAKISPEVSIGERELIEHTQDGEGGVSVGMGLRTMMRLLHLRKKSRTHHESLNTESLVTRRDIIARLEKNGENIEDGQDASGSELDEEKCGEEEEEKGDGASSGTMSLSLGLKVMTKLLRLRKLSGDNGRDGTDNSHDLGGVECQATEVRDFGDVDTEEKFVNPIRLLRVKRKLMGNLKNSKCRLSSEDLVDVSPLRGIDEGEIEDDEETGQGSSNVEAATKSGDQVLVCDGDTCSLQYVDDKAATNKRKASQSDRRHLSESSTVTSFQWTSAGSGNSSYQGSRRSSWFSRQGVTSGESERPKPAPLHSVPSLLLHMVRHNKLKNKYQMKKQRGLSHIEIASIKLPTTRYEWFMYVLKVFINDAYVRSFVAWFLWITMGALFFGLHEGHGIVNSLYHSVSLGYGLFWVNVDKSTVTRLFVRVQFMLGIFAINAVRALFAKNLIESDAVWYSELKQYEQLQNVLERSSATSVDKLMALGRYYLPKIQIYLWFGWWVGIGVLFGMVSLKWSLAESLLFSLSTMSTGGFVVVENSGRNGLYYLFVTMYIVIGVPLMTLCMSVIANSITGIGGTQIVQDTLSANITAKELKMMQVIGIVDGDGCIDCKEYTILILVRIGVLLPGMIEKINTIFINMENGSIERMTSADLSTIRTMDTGGGVDDVISSLKGDMARVTKVQRGAASSIRKR